MRQSTNRYDDQGMLVEGYDYDLQVWVRDGVILNCGHPKNMRPGCCNADKLKGQRLIDQKGEKND